MTAGGSSGFDARVAHPARSVRFLARSVRFLAAEVGIRQFLDIGTGLPTANNTREVARSVAPESRIVYLDNDPLAVPSGSYLVISHAASDIDPAPMGEMIKRMNEHLAEGNHVGRTRDVVAQFFTGTDLAEPGVVKVTQWRPVTPAEAEGPTSLWGGVGRKP